MRFFFSSSSYFFESEANIKHEKMHSHTNTSTLTLTLTRTHIHFVYYVNEFEPSFFLNALYYVCIKFITGSRAIIDNGAQWRANTQDTNPLCHVSNSGSHTRPLWVGIFFSFRSLVYFLRSLCLQKNSSVRVEERHRGNGKEEDRPKTQKNRSFHVI